MRELLLAMHPHLLPHADSLARRRHAGINLHLQIVSSVSLKGPWQWKLDTNWHSPNSTCVTASRRGSQESPRFYL
jgi:hypothetical protein